MIAIDPAAPISPDLMDELQQACDRIANGEASSLDEQRESHEDMDRIREEIRTRYGLLDVAVPSIRELRDGQ